MDSRTKVLMVLGLTILMLLSDMTVLTSASDFTSGNSHGSPASLVYSSDLMGNSVVILDNSFFQSHSPESIHQSLFTIFAQGAPFMAILLCDASYRSEFLKAWSSSLQSEGYQMPVQTVSSSIPGTNYSASFPLLPDSGVALSFRPSGEILSGNLNNESRADFATYAEDSFHYEVSLMNSANGSWSPSPVGINFRNYTGYFGIFSEIINRQIGEPLGTTAGLWTFYEATQRLESGTVYYFYGVAGRISIEGFSTSSVNWRPSNLVEETNWGGNQDQQQAWEWSPINTGYLNGTAGRIYFVQIIPVPMYFTILGTNNTISWRDQSDPALGLTKANFSFKWDDYDLMGTNTQSDTVYTVSTSSVGFIDTGRGGSPPLVINEAVQAQLWGGREYYVGTGILSQNLLIEL